MSHATLLEYYKGIRAQTERIAEGLSSEDLSAQSMPDASPGKWHLAHTSWFFETFILRSHCEQYQCVDPRYSELFNSYYETVGKRHARPQRGLITRPSVEDILSYRQHVDRAMLALLEKDNSGLIKHDKLVSINELVTVGLHHEMQHQELFLTDTLHLLSHNPMHPEIMMGQRAENDVSTKLNELTFKVFDGGLFEVGAHPAKSEVDEFTTWKTFSYDCERPRHTTYVQPFKLASRLVSNREWLEFINDGGYQSPLLWLSDGWAACQRDEWNAPLYWQQRDGDWFQFTVNGLQPLDLNAPVCHISFYEADAYARWSGHRLPTEQEWEYVALSEHGDSVPEKNNFLECLLWKPQQNGGPAFADMYGDVWEWTQSAYTPYPGYKSEQGALGEYNGKFMINQCVLKGGSCATPRLQMRPSYRNFFYPHHRWQFTGVRLAGDHL